MKISHAIKELDTSGYLEFLIHFPDQIHEASQGEIPDITVRKKDIRSIVVAGMGGSAIGGELLQSLFSGELPVPVSVIRNYDIPSHVDDRTLVIVSSYSGNTEETLSAYSQAVQAGSFIVCLTTGGTLMESALRDGKPVITLPTGYQPRAAIGFSFIPLVRLMCTTGLLSDKSPDIQETIELLRSWNRQFSPENGDASGPFTLARKLAGRIPVIYTGPAPFSALGSRWKCQFNENAKVLAYCNYFPELNHNEIVGWDREASRLDAIAAVFLRDKGESPSIARRIEITQEIIRQQSGDFFDIWSQGSSVLARAFSLIYYGDYTSYYLALLNKKDPSQIDNIKYLKNNLKKL